MTVTGVPDLPDDYERVMILSTARHHGRGPQRLPDRTDRGSAVAAIQVETNDEAARVLRALDRPGRRFYLDVERKQDIDLLATARSVVREGSYAVVKPNDITVDALEAVLGEMRDEDASEHSIAVFGTGNLGFKIALRLAERGARVYLYGRDATKSERLAAALNEILPPHTSHEVCADGRSDLVDVLISAVAADGVIGPEWLERLRGSALCIDVGINNFTAEFIEGALTAHHSMTRLDVRSAGDPLPAEPNPFFDQIAGRLEFDNGITAVAGGYVGRYGEVVLDRITPPVRVIGVANGTGGLLPANQWPASFENSVRYVNARLAETELPSGAEEGHE